ncbi:hypothetical protein Tco_1318582 [Tanacetum coccineum]
MGNVELQKTRAANTKEKLNLLVTEGKPLVQQRDLLKQKPFCKEMWYLKSVKKLSFSGVGEQLHPSDIVADNIMWLANKSITLHDEIDRTKEAANAKIDRLTVSLVLERTILQRIDWSWIIDLQRYKDKAALLREKLFLVVKKGKGLVQERDSLKQQMGEKNAQIEELKTEYIKKKGMWDRL